MSSIFALFALFAPSFGLLLIVWRWRRCALWKGRRSRGLLDSFIFPCISLPFFVPIGISVDAVVLLDWFHGRHEINLRGIELTGHWSVLAETFGWLKPMYCPTECTVKVLSHLPQLAVGFLFIVFIQDILQRMIRRQLAVFGVPKHVVYEVAPFDRWFITYSCHTHIFYDAAVGECCDHSLLQDDLLVEVRNCVMQVCCVHKLAANSFSQQFKTFERIMSSSFWTSGS